VDPGAITRRMIESLVRAGAMDGLGGTRSQLMLAVDGAMEAGMRCWRDLASGQEDLFGMMAGAGEHPDPPLPKANDWSLTQKLQGEKEMLGFYVTGHPLDQYEEKVCELTTHTSVTLEGLAKGEEVALCGVLTAIQRKRNREGKPWATLQIEDREGSTEGLLFTTQWERLSSLLEEDKAVLIRGTALPEEGAGTKVSVQDIVPLEVARVPLPSLISIKVRIGRNGLDRASELSRLFHEKPGDTQVRLRLEAVGDFAVLLDVPARVRPDKAFKAEIERICGVEMFEVLAQ
jgi:DNA polymerase-3 subunit alpha